MNSLPPPTTTTSPQQTHRFATQFAPQLPPGSILSLTGDLGAGKTTFVQGLAQGLGVFSRITSPTYILLRQYPLPQPLSFLNHLDLYRLQSTQELDPLDLPSLLHSPHHITAIEWPHLVKPLLPPHTLHLHFDTPSSHTRIITITRHES